jgi:hypothetical protein
MTNTDPTTLQRSLYNWMMDGIISRQTAAKLVNGGTVEKGKEKSVLIPYSDLQTWGVV